VTSKHTDVTTMLGRDVYDRDGDKIGSVGQVYADHAGQPTWASVNTGFFGLRQSLVPLSGATSHGDGLQVPFEKATVKDAPNVDHEVDEPLTSDQVQELYRHYELQWDTGSTADYAHGYTAGAEHTRDGFRDTGERRDDDAMTRSEERLDVGTERERTDTARLRKYVVTENVQTTVPVQREEVRVEREPVTDANYRSATSGPDITGSEHEVTLHAERPVVNKETVPVEQVRLGKETVTDEQQVGGEVRREHIDAELPGDEGRRRLA
jgi:uncharacterized protein (TIGR02271 family)